MSTPNFFVFAGNRSTELHLGAIFRDELDRAAFRLENCITSSGAITSAMGALESDARNFVALVVGAETDDVEEIEEERGAIFRLLYGAAPIFYDARPRNWHASIAVPDVDAWIMADPAIRAIFEAKEATRTNPSQRAREIGEVAARHPIDREAIARAHPDFRSLVEFIAAHAPASEAVA